MISAASFADQRMLNLLQIIFKARKVLVTYKDLDCNLHTKLSQLDVSLCK